MIVLCGCALWPRGERWLHLVRHLRQDGYIVYHPKSSVRKSERVSLFGKAIDLGYIAIIIFFFILTLCIAVLLGSCWRAFSPPGAARLNGKCSVLEHLKPLVSSSQS